MSKTKRIEKLEQEMRILKDKMNIANARLFYLAAPKAIWNYIEECWMFSAPPKFKILKKRTVLCGTITVLEKNSREIYKDNEPRI